MMTVQAEPEWSKTADHQSPRCWPLRRWQELRGGDLLHVEHHVKVRAQRDRHVVIPWVVGVIDLRHLMEGIGSGQPLADRSCRGVAQIQQVQRESNTA